MLDFNDVSTAPVSLGPDRDAVRTALLAQLESVLTRLFTAGKVRGNKFFIGNVRGEPGDSLEIELTGERAGLWFDHATGQGGDIFDLVAAAQGLDVGRQFAQVLEAAGQLAGQAIATPAPMRPREAPVDELGPETGKWDYFDAAGHLIACVYRYEPAPGKKEFRPWDAKRRKMAPPEPRPLYNQPGIRAANTVVLVEGEKCAQALIEVGVVATTAMHGANAPVDKTDWSPLAGKSVLVWPDRDKPGFGYAEAAAHAALQAGASECAILLPPDDRPEGWDVADALDEGFDVAAFLDAGPRMQIRLPQIGDAANAGDDGEEESEEEGDAAVWATEDSLALIFTRHYHQDWRYVAQWGKWLIWDGQRWRAEETLAANDLTRQICRRVAVGLGNKKLAARLSAASTVNGVERLARADRRHAATSEEWDADAWLLNTPGGVVDLRTGQIRAHARADRMTKIATATPRGECPRWRAFIDQVTQGDAEYASYLQRFVGYCLTGSTQEHALFFLYGTGANGKSVFVNTVFTLLGDYAANAPMDTFMESKGDRHPTDLAGLRGARFVGATETEQGRRWNESKIKEITGGDRVSARFMRQDFFTYTPQFKLVIAGNHKPAIRNIDEAMRRRLHLIPFTLTIPPAKRDKTLSARLLKEADGIMAWALEGCLAWQREGLTPPACVQEATDEYFEGEDALGRWLEERCERGPNETALTAALFNDWKQWAEASGEFAGSQRRFSDLLLTRGLTKWRNAVGMRGFRGIRPKERAQDRYAPYVYD